MSAKTIFFLLLGLDASILFFQIFGLSISFAEADLLYGDFSILQFITQTSLKLFGQNDFALRLPMLLFHLGSDVLLYLISKKYISQERDRLWLLAVFIMLPGVVSAGVVVHSAGYIIFALLLLVYLEDKLSKPLFLALSVCTILSDQGFLYLGIALSFYGYFAQKEKYFFLYIIASICNVYLYGDHIGGIPKGHFLDTIGVYSAIFTPVVFIYIIYGLYRSYLAKKRDLMWYMAVTSFLFSLLLSFRQQVALEYFAPYIIVALPLVAQIFITSYKVRLKEFRFGYRLAFIVSMIFLVVNFTVVLFNKELYRFVSVPKKHFAYDMHIAKELSQELKKRHIDCVTTDSKMQLRLKFYEIQQCRKYILKQQPLLKKENDFVTIGYSDKVVYNASVTKLNNR